jgi:EamA domain-containing membrane protein RarD
MAQQEETDNRRVRGSGLLYGLLAYSAWALAPVYWRQLSHLAPGTW